MAMATQVWKLRRITRNKLEAPKFPRRENFLLTALLLSMSLISAGCGETAKPVVSPAAGQVDTYFGGPFNVSGSSVAQSAAAFDHAANQIAVSGHIIGVNNTQVPTNIINGTFTTADTGFLAVTETLAVDPKSGTPTAQNPALTGAWAVEVPGGGALANFLALNNSGPMSAAPTAMAQNTACPSSPIASPFLYVTVPYAGMLNDMADYGMVQIAAQGSAVTFAAQPFLIGSNPQTTSTVTGGCSQTVLGALTAYPLNTYGNSSPLQPELISIGTAGLLVSFFFPQAGGSSAFGGGTGVIGVAELSSPVNVNSVSSATYNGFVFSPGNPVKQSNGYDITVLASAFGNHTAASSACSVLQSSLAANNGQGGRVPVLPSPNAIYGGEFLTVSSTGSVNDPSGASGSENCDVAIDLGPQDSTNNGLFPNATVFIGANFLPYSASQPGTCGGSACAVSFPAAAVVGQVQGQYVIFVAASRVSSPAAQLPDGAGNLVAQPLGIYLFQKM